MAQSQAHYASAYSTPITCQCGGTAHLIRRIPDERTGSERRIFDCVKCRELLEMVVKE